MAGVEYAFSPNDVDVDRDVIYFTSPPPVGSLVKLASDGTAPYYTNGSNVNEALWVRPVGMYDHYVYDPNPPGNPVSGVTCNVYGNANGTGDIWATGTSDANGLFRFAAPPGTYWVFRTKDGYTFVKVQVTVTEDAHYRRLNGIANNGDYREYYRANLTNACNGNHKAIRQPTTIASGAWSDTDIWFGGEAPEDGDFVVISAGHNVLVDVDLSAWTGLRSIYMDHNTVGSPPMLYFKNGTNGHLKIRYGNSTHGGPFWICDVCVNAWEWNTANRARILINANGDWDSIFPLDPEYRAVIEFTANPTEYSGGIYMKQVDVRAFCSNPPIPYVTPYGTRYDFTASAQTVDTTEFYWSIDIGVTPPALGTPIRIKSLGGTLPGGLSEDITYKVCDVSGTRLGLSSSTGSSWQDLVPITSTGSGALTLYTGPESGTTTVNVFEDVSADEYWRTDSGRNNLAVCNLRVGTAAFTERLWDECNLSYKTSSTLTLSEGLFATLYAGARIYLLDRNVEICRTGDWGERVGLLQGDPRCSNVESYLDARVQIKMPHTSYSSGSSLLANSLAYARVAGIFVGSGVGFAYSTFCSIHSIVIGAQLGVYLDAQSSFDGTIVCCKDGLQMAPYMWGSDTTGIEFSGHILGCYNGISAATGSGLIMGGTIQNCMIGVVSAYSAVIKSTIYSCWIGVMAQNCGFSGVIKHCERAIQDAAGIMVSGTIQHCQYVFFNDFIFNGSSCLIDRNVNVFYRPSGPTKMYGCTITNCFNSYYSEVAGQKFKNIISYNHNEIPNAIHVYGGSGLVTHHARTGVNDPEVPVGRDYSHMFSFNLSGEMPVFIEWDLMNFSNSTLRIVVYAKNYHNSYAGSLNLTGEQLLRWAIIDLESDPTYVDGAEYVDYWASAGNTKDWQTHTLECTRTTDKPMRLKVWANRHAYINAYAHCYLVGAGGISFGIVGTNVA